jgi:predicted RNA-binding protein associated with RNAse of E/G family
VASTTEIVRIRYRRPPDREDIFEQRRIDVAADHVVTYLDRTPLASPLSIDGRVILENGSPVVWFTFPGAWHDIGLFHRADGTFTGTYANILTPVHFVDDRTWETTDLFLDVWVGAGGDVRLLDEDELDAALRHGAIDAELALRARAEAGHVIERATAREWPPAAVRDWSLERARSIVIG